MLDFYKDLAGLINPNAKPARFKPIFFMELGQTYHIYNHSNGSEYLFRSDENYRYFLQQYVKFIHPLVDTYAYCLMGNHFHFLLKIKNDLTHLKPYQHLNNSEAEKRISKTFSNFFNSYTKAFNTMHDRKGSLFMKSFNRKAIESEEQWQETFLYINANSIHHGFTSNWKWSSWDYYRDSNKLSFLKKEEVLFYFDNIDNMRFCYQEKIEKIKLRDS